MSNFQIIWTDEALEYQTELEARLFSFMQGDSHGLMRDFAKQIGAAKKRKLEWTIPFWRYLQLVHNTTCTYCGTDRVSRCPDRINSNYGYHIGNTAPVCGACNMLKGAHTPTMFVALCHLVKHGAPVDLNRLLPRWVDHILNSKRFYTTEIIDRIVLNHPVVPPISQLGDCYFCESKHCNLVCDTGICWFCYESHFIDPTTRFLVSGWQSSKVKNATLPIRQHIFEPVTPRPDWSSHNFAVRIVTLKCGPKEKGFSLALDASVSLTTACANPMYQICWDCHNGNSGEYEFVYSDSCPDTLVFEDDS